MVVLLLLLLMMPGQVMMELIQLSCHMLPMVEVVVEDIMVLQQTISHFLLLKVRVE